jgi:metallo-beta-lactamase class B
MSRARGKRAVSLRSIVCLLALAAGLWGTPSRAEQKTVAQENDWNRPYEPFRVIGNVYYVGTIELGVYLITTPAGHLLIDGGLPQSTPVIEAAIEKAGFKLTDIKVLLTTQAHFDHVGTLAALAAGSGGQVMVMSGDAELVEHGGRGDYLFGDTSPFDPVKVARVLKDGEMVTLGDQVMYAHHTPGHTKGCTTWSTTVRDNGLTYAVVFAGSTTVNPGTRLVHNPSYPGIRADYERSFRLLGAMRPDVFLGAHAGFFDLDGKRQRQLAGATPNPFIDPKGFADTVQRSEKRFHELVAAEEAGPRGR